MFNLCWITGREFSTKGSSEGVGREERKGDLRVSGCTDIVGRTCLSTPYLQLLDTRRTHLGGTGILLSLGPDRGWTGHPKDVEVVVVSVGVGVILFDGEYKF